MSASSDVEEEWRSTLEGASRADSFPAGDLIMAAVKLGMTEEIGCSVRESGSLSREKIKVVCLLRQFVLVRLHERAATRIDPSEKRIIDPNEKTAKIGPDGQGTIHLNGDRNFGLYEFHLPPIYREIFEVAEQWVAIHPIG